MPLLGTVRLHVGEDAHLRAFAPGVGQADRALNIAEALRKIAQVEAVDLLVWKTQHGILAECAQHLGKFQVFLGVAQIQARDGGAENGGVGDYF